MNKKECRKITLNDLFLGTNENNLGIEFLNPMYIEVDSMQDKTNEWIKINKFLDSYMKFYSISNNVDFKYLKLDFINYGKTELVYVLTDENKNRTTLLVKQPAVKFGYVKQEADYLAKLKQDNANIVAPIDYFEDGEYELYATPYINQARCVASFNSWGMYVPEPFYRFQSFTNEQERVVNVCMIAKLVSLYDFENNRGLCSCKLGGGDFMLPKGWENTRPTIEDTLNNLHLIAAREMVQCDFEDYLAIIRNEFSRTTINENQDNLIINLRGRVPIQIEDIELGIEIGKNIIENKINRKVNKVKFINRLKARLR